MLCGAAGRGAQPIMGGDVEAATAKDVEEKGSPTGWLQDEDSPAQALWHAALLAATLWSCARAPLALARPARGPSPCDALADLVFVGEVFARLAFPMYDAERRELIDDPRQVRDRYLHSPQLYGNLALALPVVSGYLPLSRATAVLRTLRFTKFKPTLNTLRGTLQRTRDIHVSVELVELAAVLLYLMILTLALVSMRWAPRLPYDTRNLAITIVVVAVSLALHAVAFANLQSAVDAQNVVEASHEKQVGPVLAFLDGADVDDDARQRVRTHFDYLLVQQGGMADDQILAELSASLKRRVKDQSRALLVQVHAAPALRRALRPQDLRTHDDLRRPRAPPPPRPGRRARRDRRAAAARPAPHDAAVARHPRRPEPAGGPRAPRRAHVRAPARQGRGERQGHSRR